MKNNILIIGDYKPKNVDSCTWSESIYNLTDYDTVIIDTDCLYRFLSIDTPGSYTVVQGDAYQAVKTNLKFINQKILECLSLDIKIYVLYYPNTTVSYSYGKNAYFHTNDWCPIPLETHIEKGITINLKNRKYQQYLNKLKSWEYYYLALKSDDGREIREFYTLYYVDIKRNIIATNRLDYPIAMELAISFLKTSSSKIIELSSRIVLLPITNKDDTSVDIETIIGLTKSLEQIEAPEWVKTINIPNESIFKSELDSTEQKLVKAKDNYDNLIMHKRLLYDYSYSLQNICELTLKELGATIKPSVVTDEFIIEFKGKEALIEVKGSNKSINKDDLGQLVVDIGRHLTETGQSIKGILIGNGWRNIPPKERETGNKKIFPKEIAEAAEDHNVGLLSSVVLFSAYCQLLDGKLSKQDFFNNLFSSSGIVKL